MELLETLLWRKKVCILAWRNLIIGTNEQRCFMHQEVDLFSFLILISKILYLKAIEITHFTITMKNEHYMKSVADSKCEFTLVQFLEQFFLLFRVCVHISAHWCTGKQELMKVGNVSFRLEHWILHRSRR